MDSSFIVSYDCQQRTKSGTAASLTQELTIIMIGQRHSSTLIHNARILDSITPGESFPGWIKIENDVITDIGVDDTPLPDDCAVTIDADGSTVLPGIIDCHVHLCHTLGHSEHWGGHMGRKLDDIEQAYNGMIQAERTVRAGVTTVRDVGCANSSVYTLRDLINRGVVPGPKILAAGKIICITGGHYYDSAGREADGIDDARRAAREQIKAGADALKLAATGGARTPNERITSTQLDLDEMTAIVAEARKVGITVAAHAHAEEGIKDAIRAGVTTIEHGVFLDDEAATMMASEGVYLVPTLSVYKALVVNGPTMGAEDYAQVKAAEVMQPHRESLVNAISHGVKVAFGTDSGGPYHPLGVVSELVSEFEMMREAGMSAADCVYSATRIAAEACGLSAERGTLEKGKIADLIVVDGNPLEDVRALGNVQFVMQEGRVARNELV